MRRFIVLLAILLLVLGLSSFASKYSPEFKEKVQELQTGQAGSEKIRVVSEESVVIDVVKKVGPSVVTIAATSPQQSLFGNDPYSIFGYPGPQEQNNEPQNIGSGFIVSREGIIITNKHVVSDPQAAYTVIASSDKKYKVDKVYRDPLNDVAILKISPGTDSLPPVELGDSSKLQVGQTAIAIGTPLGEFNNSVTKGIISGLGRGITAGSSFEGFVEQLDNVIQTDAAINPGNSGGPLLNSGGQVIGINTAVSQSGQSIGFAIPINTVKDSLKNFNETGQFNRPYLGVAYRMIPRDTALNNDVPEGAYVQQVVPGSAAEKAGLKEGDIITQFEGQKVAAKSSELSSLIAKKKVGDTIDITVYRETSDGKKQTLDIKATLETAPEQ